MKIHKHLNMQTLKHTNTKCFSVGVFQCWSDHRGFSAVELIIIIAITIILAAMAAPVYGNLQSSTQLNEESAQVVQILRIARERSASGFNNARHGVKLEAGKYILYQGPSYTSRNSDYDKNITLNNNLNLVWVLSGGSSEINFSKYIGIPNSTGTINLGHSVKGNKNITINDFGLVEEG